VSKIRGDHFQRKGLAETGLDGGLIRKPPQLPAVDGVRDQGHAESRRRRSAHRRLPAL